MGQMRSEQFKLQRMYRGNQVDPNAVAEQQKKVDELRRQMLKSRIQAHNQIAALLTPEQRKELRQRAPGWLMTGVALMVTERLPCATAQALSDTAWFITTEPVRALITTLAAGAASSMDRFSTSARKPMRSSGAAGMRTRTVRPLSGWAMPCPILRLMARATSRAVL